MTLEEAIAHVAEKGKDVPGSSDCALDHSQLVEWLTELKFLRETTSADSYKFTAMFLYVLMRDHLPVGTVARVVCEIVDNRESISGGEALKHTHDGLLTVALDLALGLAGVHKDKK